MLLYIDLSGHDFEFAATDSGHDRLVLTKNTKKGVDFFMKEALNFEDFKEKFRDAYYDALENRKEVVVDGYTFFEKWYIKNHFLDHEKAFPGDYSVEREVSSLFEDDSYAENFYEIYTEWVNEDNENENRKDK